MKLKFTQATINKIIAVNQVKEEIKVEQTLEQIQAMNLAKCAERFGCHKEAVREAFSLLTGFILPIVEESKPKIDLTFLRLVKYGNTIRVILHFPNNDNTVARAISVLNDTVMSGVSEEIIVGNFVRVTKEETETVFKLLPSIVYVNENSPCWATINGINYGIFEETI